MNVVQCVSSLFASGQWISLVFAGMMEDVEDGDWARVSRYVAQRLIEIQAPTTKVALRNASGVSQPMWLAVKRGEPLRTWDVRARMSHYLGWRQDSIDLIAHGEEPIVLKVTTALEDGLDEVQDALTMAMEALARHRAAAKGSATPTPTGQAHRAKRRRA